MKQTNKTIMKKLILTLAVALLTSGAVLGQEKAVAAGTKGKGQGQNKDATPAEKAKSVANWAAKNLGLTEEQKPKWEAAALERITANTAIRERLKGCTTPEERKTLRGEMKANHDKFDNTVTAFLTEEQKVKWAKEKEDRKNKAKAKAKGKRGEVEESIED